MTHLDTPMDALLDSSHGKPRLLVADDQPVNIQVMYQIFGGDYQVFMATSGAQALNICQTNPPDLALLDGLCGVFNRRYFDQQLGIEWARASRSNAPLSIIMLDVDHFKLFNDRYGHQAGDDCLRQIAMALKTSLKRPGDLVARYGGEEFACILPDTAFDDAMGLAIVLEHRVRALNISHAGASLDNVVTASLGVSTRTVDSAGDAAALVGLADLQLYNAKQSGRGRVCGDVLSPSANV